MLTWQRWLSAVYPNQASCLVVVDNEDLRFPSLPKPLFYRKEKTSDYLHGQLGISRLFSWNLLLLSFLDRIYTSANVFVSTEQNRVTA